MRVLVTGGCGFIGSHQAIALIEAGHTVVLLDDLSNSRHQSVERIARITGVLPTFYQLDIRDVDAVTRCLFAEQCDAIIHFAALKHVGESVGIPVDYYSTNVSGLLSVISAARAVSVKNLVFSSSGSVYGETKTALIPECQALSPTNPYSNSKAVGERILQDLAQSEAGWQISLLRYFNPAGAHPSGLLGEDPIATHRNLVPLLMDVAAGVRPELLIFGVDFDTTDGTAIRDYVHVLDVAEAHVTAIEQQAERLMANPGRTQLPSRCVAINIGSGVGATVLEVVDAAQRATGREIAVSIQSRRSGDVSCLVADTSKAAEQLGHVCERSLGDICTDAWRWQQSLTQALAR